MFPCSSRIAPVGSIRLYHRNTLIAPVGALVLGSLRFQSESARPIRQMETLRSDPRFFSPFNLFTFAGSTTGVATLYSFGSLQHTCMETQAISLIGLKCN